MLLSKNKTLHFIVTRPNNRVTQLTDQLSQLEHPNFSLMIEHVPLIVIEDYVDASFFEQHSLNNKPFNGVIFISGNAIDQAKKCLSNPSELAQANQSEQNSWINLLNHPLYAIGEQTALLLKKEALSLKLNTQVHSPKQMNSEGLLAMPELASIKGEHWLIIKGVGGRKALKQGLTAAGANVLELDVYQRKLPDLIAQKQIASYNDCHNSINRDKPCPIWIITSLEALNNLWRINQNKALNCSLIVCSDRIAKEAIKKGFKIVAQSNDATDKQLVNCVQQFILNFNES